ncbi:hypothetical protein JCM6882_001974 [Rhodosporidiobolus microsporus]
MLIPALYTTPILLWQCGTRERSRACLSIGHLPSSWRNATCAVLKKPKKPDYSNRKAYRLIAFEQCVAKLVESVVARRLAYWAELHLPKEHFGGRKGRSAEEVAACAEDVIKCQWRFKRFVIAAALDAAKAFPSVRVQRVVADMRERGLPEAACRFVAAFMTRRSSESLCGFGWIDDINLLAWGDTVEEAVSAMQAVSKTHEEWSKTHRTVFEPSKTTVTLFVPPGKKRPSTPLPVLLNGVPLEYSPSLTLLGVELNSELHFKPHIASCAAKAAKALTGVALLARARAGLSPRWVRRLVNVVVTPRLLWTAAVSYDPWKQVEANLPPLDLVLRRHLHRFALRLHASTAFHPCCDPFTLARTTRPSRHHPSAFHHALHSFPDTLPPSTLVEPLIPHALPPWDTPPSFAVLIPLSKEEAERTYTSHLRSLPPTHSLLHSDGSLMDGFAGVGVLASASIDGVVRHVELSKPMGEGPLPHSLH